MINQVAIDLTPLRVGGENGGAKTLTWQLLRQFQALSPDFSFLLLTAEWNHDELAAFDGPGISRLCVVSGRIGGSQTDGRDQMAELVQQLRLRVPLAIIDRLRPAVQWLKSKQAAWQDGPVSMPVSGINLLDRGVDLLFCPFTAVTYAEPGLPVVSFVHDLQHRVFPQFFEAGEYAGRENTFKAVARRADIIICNSAYTRQTLLAHFEAIDPAQVEVIPIAVHNRLVNAVQREQSHHTVAALDRPFLFYPANYWPHKNHRLLLTAYNALRRQRPSLNLDLVFTGALSEEEAVLKTAVSQMNLDGRVHFLGFLPDEALAAVFEQCAAVIYPSLYEGFGIPLLEAFIFEKPVLCSDVASLPEVAGEAAIYFNPRKPADIIAAIETLLDEPATISQLVSQGQKRLAHYDPGRMVAAYERCFKEAIRGPHETADALHGRYEDGWLGGEVTFHHQSRPEKRTLSLTLTVPTWHPKAAVRLRYQDPETKKRSTIGLARGETTTLKVVLPGEGGRLHISFAPTFRPAEHEGSADSRHLSCMLEAWKVE